MTMEVILLSEIKNVGHKGELKNVSDGFARNYLLRKKVALIATPALKHQIQVELARINKKEKNENVQINKLASQLKNFSVNISAKANEDGTLFSGINKNNILESINNKINSSLKTDMIILNRPIKQIGEHNVIIKVNNKEYKIKVIINNHDT
ncbi:50S ribosomal protein L9 [Patescibacteria group bacterium]|nr:50S ribosomal protein L9 [Patescibacteria group bacterium]MBU0963472.1 50S ribosomal protein L9 [Patescibacteria group bacterium]